MKKLQSFFELGTKSSCRKTLSILVDTAITCTYWQLFQELKRLQRLWWWMPDVRKSSRACTHQPTQHYMLPETAADAYPRIVTKGLQYQWEWMGYYFSEKRLRTKLWSFFKVTSKFLWSYFEVALEKLHSFFDVRTNFEHFPEKNYLMTFF